MRVSRRVVWIAAALTTGAALSLLYRPGYQRRHEMQAALAVAEAEHQSLEAQQAELSARVERLRDDPLELEREAREQLGLVRPGEVIYKFPAGDSAAPERRGSAKTAPGRMPR